MVWRDPDAWKYFSSPLQDRRSISLGNLIESPPITDLTQAPVRNDDEDETIDDLRSGSSAKIDQLVHLLRLTPSTEKSLVFSQFTSFLDKVWHTIALIQFWTHCVVRLAMRLMPQV